jgi:hypothetical protein
MESSSSPDSMDIESNSNLLHEPVDNADESSSSIDSTDIEGNSNLLHESVDNEDEPHSLLDSMENESDSDSTHERVESEDDFDCPSGQEETGFDQTVLNFIHNGSFARRLRQCVGSLVNLQQVWVDQPHIEGDLMELGVEDFRLAWSTVVETTLDTICVHGIHLTSLELHNDGGPKCPVYPSSLRPLSNGLGLFDLMTSLCLELYVAEDEREYGRTTCIRKS